MNSSLTASPFIQVFKHPPIMTLRPRFKSKANIARWRLRITDGSGNVFRDFSGHGSLPEEIIWDGRSAKAEMADVGISYSYIFSIIDEASNPTSQMGRPVILESLLYEENGVKIAKVLIDTLFAKKERGTAISPKGEMYLKEMSDILTARQSYPLTIESYAKDIDAANSNGELIQEYLSTRLILPKEKFKIVPYKSRLEKISFLIK
jgi:hypothetical protein